MSGYKDTCTKFDFGGGFAPHRIGELTALPDPLTGFKGLTPGEGEGKWRRRKRRGCIQPPILLSSRRLCSCHCRSHPFLSVVDLQLVIFLSVADLHTPSSLISVEPDHFSLKWCIWFISHFFFCLFILVAMASRLQACSRCLFQLPTLFSRFYKFAHFVNKYVMWPHA